MSRVELDRNDVLAAEAKIPSGVAVTMINLVAFFPEAQYEDANENRDTFQQSLRADSPPNA